jgi:uncharacterized protein YndB with AHSA1/START domain
MAESRFVYVTYIRTTPEKLFAALTQPEFTRQYWAGTHQVSDWNKGSSWAAMAPDGRVADSGAILEIDPPRKLVISWKNQFLADLKDEGFSRCTYEIEQAGSSVKLTLTHEMDAPNSKLIAGVSEGWPHILASLKSLLETGSPIVETSIWPEGM